MTNNIAVYTANFGRKRDIMHPALHNNADYIQFTTHPQVTTGWTSIHASMHKLTPRHASRYYFDQSCLVLPSYGVTIMHGANGQLQVDPVWLVKMYLPTGIDLALLAHPHRKSVYEEAKACILYNKDDTATINAQMNRYRDDGFPDNVGLSCCGLIIRRNTMSVREFETAWWEEVKAGSYRDQLSFDYTRWKLDFPIATIPGDIFNNPLITIHPHKQEM